MSSSTLFARRLTHVVLALFMASAWLAPVIAEPITFTNYNIENYLSDNAVNGVYASRNTIYVATSFGGLNISTDGGSHWTHSTTNNGLGSNTVYGVYANGSTVYAATFGGGLSISGNGGTSWTTYTTANGLGDNRVNGVFVSGDTIYAATASGLSISGVPEIDPTTGSNALSLVTGVLAMIERRRRGLASALTV